MTNIFNPPWEIINITNERERINILTTKPRLWRQLMTFKKGPFLTSHRSPLWNSNSLARPNSKHPLLKFSMFVMATKGDITFFWNWTGFLPSCFKSLLISLKYLKTGIAISYRSMIYYLKSNFEKEPVLKKSWMLNLKEVFLKKKYRLLLVPYIMKKCFCLKKKGHA